MRKAGYLNVRTTRCGPVCVLAVAGELDMLTVADLAEAAAAALTAPIERFVLELSRLTFLDCSGARALAAVARAVPAECPVIVRAAAPAARRVMDLMGVNLERRQTVPGSRTAVLALESQRLCSLAQQTVADSRALGEMVAVTEASVAHTLTRLADRRLHSAGRLPLRAVTSHHG